MCCFLPVFVPPLVPRAPFCVVAGECEVLWQSQYRSSNFGLRVWQKPAHTEAQPGPRVCGPGLVRKVLCPVQGWHCLRA